MEAGRGDLLQKAQDAENMALQGNLPAGGQPGLPSGQPQPGVFEGGGPGAGGVPDLGALATAPNGAGAGAPPYGQVMGGTQQPGGTMPPGGMPLRTAAGRSTRRSDRRWQASTRFPTFSTAACPTRHSTARRCRAAAKSGGQEVDAEQRREG